MCSKALYTSLGFVLSYVDEFAFIFRINILIFAPRNKGPYSIMIRQEIIIFMRQVTVTKE